MRALGHLVVVCMDYLWLLLAELEPGAEILRQVLVIAVRVSLKGTDHSYHGNQSGAKVSDHAGFNFYFPLIEVDSTQSNTLTDQR